MTTTAIAHRFPAHQGFTRYDDIGITAMTAYALAAYGRGQLPAADLAAMLGSFRLYRDDAHWAAIGPRGRALLMADGMGHRRRLTELEAAWRRNSLRRPGDRYYAATFGGDWPEDH